MNNLSLAIAKKLLILENGEMLTGSSFNKIQLAKLEQEGIVAIQRIGRTKTRVRLNSEAGLANYLRNRYQIENLEAYVEMLQQIEISGREAQQMASNTKLRTSRTFKGFLVNVIKPIKAKLHGKEIVIEPRPGTFTFIHDYENFEIDKKVLIIGMENPENFRFIELQDALFPKGEKLFLSRYPQTNDLVNWLSTIPNSYLHFGDFDLAGISIFENEYSKKLGEKASFFIPDDIEKRIAEKGNRDLYNKQYVKYNTLKSSDTRLQALIDLIHANKKGLEQEAFIGNGMDR
ncbi:hypothetical protein G3O08_01935 [Cryomorpha ignava]|uniref:DUF7281 domain-containing protein n=1 Tax=Cryomorpha ignava TaxID=101383 RepID=A0A7K3WL98_9FLAO|nr:hypothetical protein [Cryomorpha ignava]NEN22264.1 hypothetical protein [Cryomorpha ignava]